MPSFTSRSSPDTPPGRPPRSLARGVRKLWSPWTAVAIVVAVILLGVYIFLTTSLSCAVTDYSSEITSDGNIVTNVTVKNFGIKEMTVLVRTVVDLQNETFEKRYQDNDVVRLQPGEERTVSIVTETGLQPPVPSTMKAYAFVLPSH